MDIEKGIEELFVEAIDLYAIGDIDGAIKIWKKILQKDPDNSQARFYVQKFQKPLAASSLHDRWENDEKPVLKHSAKDFSEQVVNIEMPAGSNLAQYVQSSDTLTYRKGVDVLQSDDVLLVLQGARELFALDDFSGAYELFKKVLLLDPDNEEALNHVITCRDTLLKMFESKFGSNSAIPKIAVDPEEIIWLNLDHRAGFVLARIDGQSSIEEIAILSGMDQIDAYRILSQLITSGAITV